MTLLLTEEDQLLRDSAKRFLAEYAPVAQMRQLRDDKDTRGYSEWVWSKMVEMGWSSVIIPEQYGGLDFGFKGLATLLEETGRCLTASPAFVYRSRLYLGYPIGRLR